MWIARGRPNRALSSRFGKHKYGFHGGAADPPCMDAPRDASDFFLLDMVERSSSSVYPASLCSSVRCGPSWWVRGTGPKRICGV